MAHPALSLLLDTLFCCLLCVFVRADQAWLAARYRARGRINFRPLRALPFVVLGALLGLLVLPIYWCASRPASRGSWLGFGFVALLACARWAWRALF